MSLKPGRLHVLGDVLSRPPHVKSGELSVGNCSVTEANIELNFYTHYRDDHVFGSIFKHISGDQCTNPVQADQSLRLAPSFELRNNILYYKERICVPCKVLPELLSLSHDCKTAGHFGFAKTLGRLKNYHCKYKSKVVKQYCDDCLVHQQNKDMNQKRFGVPQPLQGATRLWGSRSTSFIVQLAETASGFDAITTWVDRLSRRVHSIPSRRKDTASDCAKSFFSNIFKLHGLPDNIISYRDPKFTSRFWTELLGLRGVQLRISTSHDPQTGGLSEVMIRMVEHFIRCYCALNQKVWDDLLPAAEFSYNSAITEDLGMTSFELGLGCQPKAPADFLRAAEPPIESVNEFKRTMGETVRDAQFATKFQNQGILRTV